VERIVGVTFVEIACTPSIFKNDMSPFPGSGRRDQRALQGFHAKLPIILTRPVVTRNEFQDKLLINHYAIYTWYSSGIVEGSNEAAKNVMSFSNNFTS
jgi:hypothetical protein